MIEHNYVAHEREGWSVCTRCGMVRNYDRPIAGCRGVIGNIAVRGGMTMTTVEEETETPVCSVCARPTGFADEDKGEPPACCLQCKTPLDAQLKDEHRTGLCVDCQRKQPAGEGRL